MPAGVFLSLDGLDGTGKSTQCRLLADWLRRRGLAVTECIEPGGTPLGTTLREIVLHYKHDLALTCEALLSSWTGMMSKRTAMVVELGAKNRLRKPQNCCCDRAYDC